MKFFALSLFLVLSGCAGKPSTAEKDWNKYYSSRTPSSAPVHGCVAKTGPNCRAKIMWHCPTGFIDGCNTPGSTGNHECVTRDSDTPCNLRAEMLCPEGFEDGCELGASVNHECVAHKSAAPCTEEKMIVCPEGFVDACNRQ